MSGLSPEDIFPVKYAYVRQNLTLNPWFVYERIGAPVTCGEEPDRANIDDELDDFDIWARVTAKYLYWLSSINPHHVMSWPLVTRIPFLQESGRGLLDFPRLGLVGRNDAKV